MIFDKQAHISTIWAGLNLFDALIAAQPSGENAEEKAKIAAQLLTGVSQAGQPHHAYHELVWREKPSADDFRDAWVKSAVAKKLPMISTPEIWKIIEEQKPDLALFPEYSWFIQLKITLTQPYLSRDDNLFYIIDNPVKRDKIFNRPYVAASSWKGCLRSALWHLDHEKYAGGAEITRRLFGNERGIDEQERLRAGRLYFYPTFFNQIDLEVINPHDRKTRAGKRPIYLECVRVGAAGVFTLLYLPFDRIGLDESDTRLQVNEDLQAVAAGLPAMFTVYGFGAKTSSGYGTAKDGGLDGLLAMRAVIGRRQEHHVQAGPQPGLPRYLEAPDKLKPEFRNEDGSFRTRSEEEIARLKKKDKQLYEKARAWWEKEGRAIHEAQGVCGVDQEADTSKSTSSASWPSCNFNTFGELQRWVDDLAAVLKGEVVSQ